jgi:hypothetical protein
MPLNMLINTYLNILIRLPLLDDTIGNEMRAIAT